MIIGLFGTTVPQNQFRKEIIIPKLKSHGLMDHEIYDPFVDNWTPECALEEAKHLASDDVIIFVVTKDSYGIASLAEIGIQVARCALKANKHLIVYIENELLPELKDNVMAKDVLNARKITLAHLSELNFPNVHICASIEETVKVACAEFHHDQ